MGGVDTLRSLWRTLEISLRNVGLRTVCGLTDISKRGRGMMTKEFS